MFIPHKAYVLVVDGARMQVLQNCGPFDEIELELVGEATQSNPASHLLDADRPGRAFESTGQRRHAYPATDLHQAREDEFVIESLAQLGRLAGDEGAIVIIAPPRILGQLRERIDRQHSARVHAELDKDLAHRSAREIELFLRIHQE